MAYLLGKKIGMTRVYLSDGRAVPVTAVHAENCVVTQIRTMEKDGYEATQIGAGIARHPKQPQSGHTKAIGHTPHRLHEFKSEVVHEVGALLSLDDFNEGDRLRISSVSKGKGFAGVIKRHNFHRGPQTHGSDHHRAPGSIGSMFPQHVLRGKKMPGRMGNDRVTIRGVKVIRVDAANGIILLKGAVPGATGSYVEFAHLPA